MEQTQHEAYVEGGGEKQNENNKTDGSNAEELWN
jgi:hypothetical protein